MGGKTMALLLAAGETVSAESKPGAAGDGVAVAPVDRTFGRLRHESFNQVLLTRVGERERTGVAAP